MELMLFFKMKFHVCFINVIADIIDFSQTSGMILT